MGKVKCKKTKKYRDLPTGIPSEKELLEDELNQPKDDDSTVDSVIEKLLSSKAEDKELGAAIIAQNAENKDFVSKLFERNIIKIAAPLLIDKNMSVCHVVCGCLRNLSSCVDPSVSEAMVEQDVMTVLVTLLKQYKTSWVPIKLTNGKIDSKKEIFIEACSLLSNLCESSSTAVEILNKNDLLPILMSGLNIDNFGIDIVLVIARCIYIILEDNLIAIEALNTSQNSELFQLFLNSKSEDPMFCHLKALAAGIVLNMNYGKVDSCGATVVNVIANVICEALEIPIDSKLEELEKAVTSFMAEKKNKLRDDEELERKEAIVTQHLSDMKHALTSKQIALEILTNICCNDDKNDDLESASSSTNDEDMDMVIDGNDEEDSIQISMPQFAPCEVHELIVNKELTKKVLNQIVLPCEVVRQKAKKSSELKTCLKELCIVRCRAMLCANNIVQVLDIEELGGETELFKLWMNLAHIMFAQTEPDEKDHLEAATSSVRAVLQKLAETKSSEHFSELTEPDLKLLLDVYLKSSESGVKVNIIRSAVTIGCILSDMKQDFSTKYISIIGAFLIEASLRSSDVWVIAEALDAIFDLFAEDHLDIVAKEIGLVDKLQHLQPLFKMKIKQSKSCMKEHLPIITTARMNLARFIKYKNKNC